MSSPQPPSEPSEPATEQSELPSRRSAASAGKLAVFVGTALTAGLADLISKLLVVAHIKTTDSGVRLLGGAIYLVQARNSGAAFSVGTGATIALTAISVIVVVVIARAARRLTSTAWAVSLGLVLGGALGNLTDRFFRAPSPGKGHVVDWISLFANDGHIWPIFNLADSSIVVGGVIAVLLSVLGVDFRGGRNPRPSTEPPAPVAGDPPPQHG
ncbi:MAG: signal peptidase II [Jatrophihabitans sp.]